MRQLIKKQWIKSILLLVLMACASSFKVNADERVIKLTPSACEVTALAENGNGCNENQCGADTSCICVKKGDHVKWLLATGEKFKLVFNGDSPLKDTCGKNFKKGKHKCVVKNEVVKGDAYNYLVKLERCSEGSDPKIIIR